MAGDVRRDHVALVLADVGERPDAGHVADRPQALTRAHALVAMDPWGGALDAARPEADSLAARAPTGRDQELVAPQVRSAVELQDVLVPLPPRGGGVLPEPQLDAVPAQGLGQRLAQ